MPKRQSKPIRTEAYFPLTEDGSIEVNMDEMTENQRDYAGALLKIALLNAACAGWAKFSADLPPREEVFPQLKQIKQK